MANPTVDKNQDKKLNGKKPTDKTATPATKQAKPNQGGVGEGDRVSDKKYRDDVQEFAKTDNPEQRARDAEKDIERNPQQYADAERDGKSRVAEDEDPNIMGSDRGTSDRIERSSGDANKYKH